MPPALVGLACGLIALGLVPVVVKRIADMLGRDAPYEAESDVLDDQSPAAARSYRLARDDVPVTRGCLVLVAKNADRTFASDEPRQARHVVEPPAPDISEVQASEAIEVAALVQG